MTFFHWSDFYHSAFAHTVAGIKMKFSFALLTATDTIFPMIYIIVMPLRPLVIVSERGYLTAVGLGITPRAVPRLAACRLATGRYVYSISFFKIVCVFPYRIKRHISAYRVGKNIPHSLTVCVERKADEPRALLGRKHQPSYYLPILDRYIRNITATLRVKSNGKVEYFIFTTISPSRLYVLFTAVGIARHKQPASQNQTANYRN